MAIGGVNVGQELLNVPMGDMIRSMALAIAQAQWELDKSSMVVTELMSGQRLLRDLDTGALLDEHGKPLGQNAPPKVIDSRVYFGYNYGADGKTRTPQLLSMMELGFVPTFYQFVETTIEVRIDIHITSSTDTTQSSSQSSTAVNNNGYWWNYNRNYGVSTAQVNAGYANKFSVDVTGSSFLRTKLVPIPPPAILETRIRQLIEAEQAYLSGLTAAERPTVKVGPGAVR